MFIVINLGYNYIFKNNLKCLLKIRQTNFASSAKSVSNLRKSITINIAKSFNNVPLVDLPLVKPDDFDLSCYKDIERAYQNCSYGKLDENPNYYPSITTILSQTMPPESVIALKKWESEKIKKLGKVGFLKYKNNLFARGKLLHNNIETYLKTRDISKLNFTTKDQENMWKSVEHVMPKIKDHHASELHVYHPILKYRGIADSIVTFDDIPTILEWKTSEKNKPTIAHTYDNPLQAIAYFSCIQYQQQVKHHIPNINEVILIIAYENGTKATVHLLESSFRVTIWKKFLKRLEQYWTQMANTSL